MGHLFYIHWHKWLSIYSSCYLRSFVSHCPVKIFLSCKHLIYSDSSKQLPSTVMSSNARGSSISSLQATQSSSMESLESSMSTTESTIGVCPCAHVCVSVCTYVCLCPSCMPVLECSRVAVSRGFWDRGRGELQRMGDDIFHFCKPFSLPKYQLQHETHALLKPVCKLTRTKTTPSSWLSANCHPTSQKFCLACVTFLPPLPRGRQCPSGDSSAGECCSEIGARDLEAEVQEPDRGESPAASG